MFLDFFWLCSKCVFFFGCVQSVFWGMGKAPYGLLLSDYVAPSVHPAREFQYPRRQSRKLSIARIEKVRLARFFFASR